MLEQALISRPEIVERIHECERRIAAARAEQVRWLRELGRRRWDMGVRELAATLDLAVGTANQLVDTSRRTPEESSLMADLESGEASFDRTAVTARLVASGASPETVADAAAHDIAGASRIASLQKRITRRSERRAHAERSVRTWSSLDETVGFLSAQLPSTDWAVVTAALDDRSSRLRSGDATATQRRADALVALAQDWLDGTLKETRFGSANPVVSVVVDPALVAESGGEAGAGIVAGPRVGPDTLDQMMCDGSVEILVAGDRGAPLAVGPTTRVIPPKVRRLVLARDGGCVVDGCDSTYRLEVHHIVPRSQGGTHSLENLGTFCWWHHHREIHGRGCRIDPGSPPHRRRLLPPAEP